MSDTMRQRKKKEDAEEYNAHGRTIIIWIGIAIFCLLFYIESGIKVIGVPEYGINYKINTEIKYINNIDMERRNSEDFILLKITLNK